MDSFHILVGLIGVCTCAIHALPTQQHGLGTQRRQSYYEFWKITSQQMIPGTTFLQKRVLETMFRLIMENDMCRGQNQMNCARNMFEKFQVPKFPSQKTLDEEEKSQKTFVKKLLKEGYFILESHERLLDKLCTFQCEKAADTEICGKLTSVAEKLKEITSSYRKQLEGYFQVKFGQNLRRTKIEKLLKVRRRKPKNGVALLYSTYNQLHETEAALKYALEVTSPSRWRSHLWELKRRHV